MRRCFGKHARRTARTAFRAFAYAALAVKLLIPVGYMPAALATGSPIELCDAGPAALLGARPAVPPAAHAHSTGHAAHHVPASEPSADGHEHHDPTASHHPWERCALGSLASLAAMHTDWHFTVPALRPVFVATAPDETFGREAAVPFRSRAPPRAPS